MNKKDIGLDLLADLGETALGLVTSNEVLKEIPILSTAVGLARLGKNFRERAFLNMIATFLRNLPEQTTERRKRLAEEARLDSKRRLKYGEALFTTLEQADSTVKAEYAALVFSAFVDGEISDRELRGLCHGIRVAQVDELVEFAEGDTKPMNMEHLAHTGLAGTRYPQMKFDGNTKPEFAYTKIGGILRELLARRKKV